MSQAHVEQVLGRMLSDDGFRLRASWNLAGACREEGYLLNDGELRMLDELDAELLEPLAAPSYNRVTFDVQGE